jgi:hypothetical protein
VSVLTQHNDNARTGANTAETCLSPSTVSSLTQRAQLHLDGQVYAQPLVLAGSPSLLIVASTANEIAAFDIGTLSTTPVWQLGPDTLGTPGNVIRGVVGPLGILSTPAIDPATQHLYAVARSCASATTIDACPWTLHVVDAPSGKHLDSVVIAASFHDSKGGLHAFDPDVQWNRPGLLVQNGQVVVGFEVGQNANQPENTQPYHGWAMSYDAANIHAAPATFVTMPDGYGAGIWQGGGGPAGDGTAVYLNTANSITMPTLPGPSSFAATPSGHENSIVRLDYADGGVSATSYFDNRPYHSDGNVFQYTNYYDEEISSSGLALIPGSNDLVAGSKPGIMYLVDRTTMQQTQTPISPFTATALPPGQTLFVSGSSSPAVVGTPVVWSRATDSVVFVWPYSDHLTSLQYQPGAHTLGVLAQSADASSAGGMLSLSVNGTQADSAVVWANVAIHGGNVGVAAEIRAYDPTALTVIWRAPLPGYAKWVCPTVSGGRVYVPTWTPATGSEVYVFTTPSCGG